MLFTLRRCLETVSLLMLLTIYYTAHLYKAYVQYALYSVYSTINTVNNCNNSLCYTVVW